MYLTVALCVRAQLRHNNNTIHECSCALESAAAAPQFAYSQLKTQKEGHEASDIATDVRKSHEVEKEHQEATATPAPPLRGRTSQ